ncbi:glycosyl hydrolase family 18 protein [Paenibacillus motobuensis]|uniref:fibronectin type III domain-containing protein n=1 Tax=Paenibacillus TaxID=44249 RepID=UPI00203E0911|nr:MULTISPECIES: glycosyl hydrolase family 18 protein [Paenibacillus]MCM3042053.1 glycosyl hydrolase family 18 protein [Paenibacillus lutimineralis]MCM3649157.1 glycosyl hydrolase family 18 protein [Paenibacillus motobuensis]
MRRMPQRTSKGIRRGIPVLLIIALLVALLPSLAFAADRGAWAPNVAYQANDTVTYGGNTYKALQAHTSLVGWEPTNVPALWQQLQGGTSDTQAPTAPGNLNASGITSSSVTLQWTASTDNVGVTEYVIYQGTATVGSVSGSTLTFTHTGLTPDTTYSYSVKAKDAAGNVSPSSNTISVKTNAVSGPDTQAPSTPANVTVTGVTSSSVSLSWTASTDNVGVTGYDVYQGTNLALSVTGTSATVSGLSAGTAYTFKVAAKDAAGNVSPQSTAVSATTTGGGGSGGQLPKHTLTGYWHNFINGSSNIKLSDVPSQYDIIALSFAEMDPAKPGGVTFNVNGPLSNALGGYTNADLINDIQAKRAQGKKVILSIGGELGNVNLNNASPNVANFVDSMYGLITQYGLDGIDIDLENGMNVTNLTSAVRQLQAKVGSGFILTMAPQTIDMQSPNTTYMQLYNNLKDITTVINVQYYNSGCMLGRDGKCYSQGTIDFLTALSDLTLQWVEPSQLGIGVPATSGAAGGGYVSPTVVNNALKCLTNGTDCGTYKPVAKYPDFRGAMTWSINWDKTTNYSFANTVKPLLLTLP